MSFFKMYFKNIETVLFISKWNNSPAANSNFKDTFYVPVVESSALPVKGRQDTWWQFTKVITSLRFIGSHYTNMYYTNVFIM